MTQGGQFRLTLGQIAERFGWRLIGEAGDVVSRVRDPEIAEPGDLTFCSHPSQLTAVYQTRATALLASLSFAAEHAHDIPCSVLAAEDPHLALVNILDALHPAPEFAPGVHPTAVIDPDAEIGTHCSVGAYAVIGRSQIGHQVVIGPGTVIDDDVTIEDGVRIGADCVCLRQTHIGQETIVHPGVVIGADGFGYAPDGATNIKVPQVGGVTIGNQVEIGANTCIDRGALSDTRIGSRTKIDNQVQIAHGAQIGEDVVIIAQTAIGGGARIGHRTVLAGQSAVVQFATIGDDCRIGAQSGVNQNVPANSARTGSPAFAHADWLKSSVRYKRLDAMHRRLAAAETRIIELESQVDDLFAQRGKQNS